jgi:hypothetical protein
MTGGRPAVTLVESATERGAGAGRSISRVCPNGPMSSRMVGGARDFRIRRTGPSACCTAIGHAVRIAAGDTILTDTPDSRKANPRLTGRRPGCWEPCPPVLHHMCPAQSARRLSNVSPIRTNDSVSRALNRPGESGDDINVRNHHSFESAGLVGTGSILIGRLEDVRPKVTRRQRPATFAPHALDSGAFRAGCDDRRTSRNNAGRSRHGCAVHREYRSDRP